MSFITLDFETPFEEKKKSGSELCRYSLKNMTYEEYINDPRFKAHGVGIKIDDGPEEYFDTDIATVLSKIFVPGNNHTLLCHNALFDGAILSWYYGLRAERYYCTQAISRAMFAQSPASLASLAERVFPNDLSKRKGKELETVAGLWDLTEEQQEVLGGYCKQDVRLTFEIFAAIWPYFPEAELAILDMTLKMFIHPSFVLDREKVKDYLAGMIENEKALVKASGFPKTILSSNKQFAAKLYTEFSIVVPMKASPTEKNPNNETLALAKDDLEYLEIQAEHPELKNIWDARKAVKSTLERTRCVRLLDHSAPSDSNPEGRIAAPLNYCAAHTKRWGGTNKVNFQNFGRGSPIRYSLYAPEGHKVVVRDLSNIEGRMNAWQCEQEDKLQQFRIGEDIYNLLATDIYGFPVDRKAKVKDSAGNFLDDSGAITDYDNAAYLQYEEGFVGKTAELGLGYQTGANTLWMTLQQKGVNVDKAFAARTVNTWRRKNYKIVAGWKKCERIIFDMASRDLEPYAWKSIIVERGRLRLPNGLYMTYPDLTMVGEEGTGYRNFEYWNGKFMKSIYGGALLENIIQAISRCVMSDMMLRINDRIKSLGAWIALTVHDEIIAIAPTKHADRVYEIMGEEMAIPPSWCNDGTLTLASEGGIADNYSK
ncbi:MAG: DNA polymerase [Cellvibrionaceae bacterium]